MMFKQIKYSLLDIKTAKRISIIFLLQMIVVFLLIDYSITDIIRVNNGINRLEQMKDNKAYVNRDGTSNQKIDALYADEENSIPKMKELYRYMLDNNRVEKYSKWKYQTFESIDGNTIVQSTSNKMFFDIYDINVIKGRVFNESDFLNNSPTTPIVVGYNLKDRYKLGEEYSEIDPVTNKKVTYHVIGILKHNSSYPSLVDIGQELNLNYTYFKLLNVESLSDFGSLYMAIHSTVIFTNNENEVRDIEEKSVEMGLFSMNYRPIQEWINEYIFYFKKKLIYQLFLAFIVLMFAGISMALNLTTMISKKMKEFSIHMICGGRISSILQRLIWQLLIILSIALIPAAMIFGVNTSLLYTIIVACLISVLIMIMPYVKIKTTNIIQLVRRSE